MSALVLAALWPTHTSQHKLIHSEQLRPSNKNQAITCMPTDPFRNQPRNNTTRYKNPASAALYELFQTKPLERLVAELYCAVLSLI